MIALEAPSSLEDDAYLKDICTDSAWSVYHIQWSSCYQAYRNDGGNPWSIAAASFPDGLSAAQRKLYENRKSSLRFRSLRGLQVPNCPMCGSAVTGTLDHFLPKEAFPEFSVMAANLVPACAHCNSSVKGRNYKGATSDEWLIHPYFDTLAKGNVWDVQVVPPYEAARFEVVPCSGHAPSVQKRIAFHLKFVLGEQFQRFCANTWATLPQVIRNFSSVEGGISIAETHKQLAKLVDYHVVSMGANAWQSAFHRGLLGDPFAQTFIADKATLLSKS